MAAFKLDEGFSEASGFMDARDEDDNAVFPEVTKAAVEEWVMAQDEDARRDIALEILRTVRSSSITAVITQLLNMLQRDPVQRLPAEITSEVFAVLDAPTLLRASLVSKTWRQRILDSQLWKRLYASEGWGVDNSAILNFEKALHSQSREQTTISSTHLRDSGIDLAEPKQKRRAPSNWLDDRQRSVQMSPLPMDSNFHWNEQHGKIEADASLSETSTQTSDADQIMQDATSPLKMEYQPSAAKSNKRSSNDVAVAEQGKGASIPGLKRSSSGPATSVTLNLIPSLRPSLTLLTPSGSPKLNWTYLYKQRRRLEDNWNRCRYINYQLPRVGYEYEGHRECIYTIQFFGKWLVSGSRDHTMKVWDLETKRVRGPPLVGHTQSVLCLQFDPRPHEDVVISGSSDTTVKIWRFSTGELLQTLRAHRESVLNLRFDHRYLITCSKDKLIKVWNRREMDPLDSAYPQINHRSNAHIPSYIIDTSTYTPLVLEQKVANRSFRTLAPYTLLMQLDGHGAAVNAIQIEGDKIVSASGDRNIKIWNIRDGKLLLTLMGHHKGIACVQFDSKRIISGSSDNTIRIFDQATGAEVACLRGHENLVRTVQAGFGDLPGSEEELRIQVETAERKWREMFERGDITRQDLQVQRRSRTRPSDNSQLVAIGAALPPGGGGSHWGRIVSGSYDEHIIIWKKDERNDWVPAHRLSHADASHIATAIGGAHLAVSSSTEGDSTSKEPSLPKIAPTSGPSSAPPNLSTGSLAAPAMATTTLSPLTPGLQLQGQAPGVHQAAHQLHSHALMMNQANITTHNHQALARMLHPAPPLIPVQEAVQPGAQEGQAPPGRVGGRVRAAQQTGPHRVFKLQFDSRKIVCCSQDPRIVVWDFANGDREIEECSQFFVGP